LKKSTKNSQKQNREKLKKQSILTPLQIENYIFFLKKSVETSQKGERRVGMHSASWKGALYYGNLQTPETLRNKRREDMNIIL